MEKVRCKCTSFMDLGKTFLKLIRELIGVFLLYMVRMGDVIFESIYDHAYVKVV